MPDLATPNLTPIRKRTRSGTPIPGRMRSGETWTGRVTEAAPRRAARPRRTSPEFRKALKDARKHVTKILGRIGRARIAGDRHRTRGLKAKARNSYHVKLLAADRANRKMRPRYRVGENELMAVAAGLDSWGGTDESVFTKAVRKGYSDFRPVLRFGIRNRALQEIEMMLLEPGAAIRDDQFSIRGGTNAAGREVLNNLGNHGGKYKHVVVSDVTNFFGSINVDHLADLLDIPPRVVDNVVSARNLNLDLQPMDKIPCAGGLLVTTHLGLLSKARAGVPQGSSLSPLVAAIVLARVLDQLPEDVKVVAYADDVLVLVRTKREAVAIANALRLALARNPLGPFRCKLLEIRRASWGFEFLGYKFKVRSGRPFAEPTKRNRLKFERRFNKDFRKERRLIWLRRYVRAWSYSRP